jgi:short-subunit dehydrogenase
MHGFFDSLRSEVAPLGVDVLLVCPSFIATRIDRNALGGDGRPVRHAQVTVGQPLSPEDAAAKIFAGAERGQRQLFIGRTARMAWWLSRIAPRLYEQIMARRLGGELESDDGPAGARPGREKR